MFGGRGRGGRGRSGKGELYERAMEESQYGVSGREGEEGSVGLRKWRGGGLSIWRGFLTYTGSNDM